METVLITGASGFIGKALASKMADLGYQVFAMTRGKNIPDLSGHKNIQIISADGENRNTLCGRVDIFIHLAWEGISHAKYQDIDVQKRSLEMTINMMNTAIDLKCKKFIFAGTNQFYLKNQNIIDNLDGYCSIYGAFKLACKEICQAMAFNHLQFNTVVFTNVFGVGDKSKRTTNLFIDKMQTGIALDLIEGNHLYDWTYIEDAIDGIITVVQKGINNREYYIGNRKLKTFREILLEVKHVLNSSATLNFGKYSDTSYTDYSNIDLNALYHDTGFECKADFRESILKTAEWIKSCKY